MSEEISFSLSLLGIGMVTVFLVLTLVFVTGKVLIKIVNRLTPNQSIAKKKIAAITTALDLHTGGNLTITKIERKIN